MILRFFFPIPSILEYFRGECCMVHNKRQLCAAKLDKIVKYGSSFVFSKDPEKGRPRLPKYW